MKVAHLIVNVNSATPESLVAFYRDVVGLNAAFDIAPGAFRADSSPLIDLLVEGHSELDGPNREPARVLLNFVVDDVTEEQRRLQERGVRFVQTAYEEPGVGVFATFEDPDGNYCQLVELRGESEGAAAPA